MSDANVVVEESERRLGFLAVAGAYTMWGFLPLYFVFMAFADPREILGQRILWSAPAALVAMIALGGLRGAWRDIRIAMTPRMIGVLALSSIFIFGNWSLYLWLVLEARVLEASLAYFIAPLVSIGIGVLLFGERISTPVAIALALAALGVTVQGVAMGGLPWPSLAVCMSWSAYALIRKQAPVPATAGLFVESLVLTPIAIGLLVWTSHDVGLRFADGGFGQAALLAISGPLTATPLILFAFGARRVSFTAMGVLQFLAPSIQFLLGLAMGEHFNALSAVAFALIWLGLIVFCWESWMRGRRFTGKNTKPLSAEADAGRP